MPNDRTITLEHITKWGFTISFKKWRKKGRWHLIKEKNQKRNETVLS